MNCRSESDNKNIIDRLNKIEGQIKGIKNMIIEDKCCKDVINQVLSVSSALKSVYQIMTALHINHCILNLEKKERNEAINEILVNLQKLK